MSASRLRIHRLAYRQPLATTCRSEVLLAGMKQLSRHDNPLSGRMSINSTMRSPFSTGPGLLKCIHIGAILALLAGCATTEPRVSTVTNTVSVPVPVQCLKASDVPARPVPVPIAPKATHDQIDAANAADLENMDAYATELEAAIKPCIKP